MIVSTYRSHGLTGRVAQLTRKDPVVETGVTAGQLVCILNLFASCHHLTSS